MHFSDDELELVQIQIDADRYRWLRDPCSGAERLLTSRGDYGRGLPSSSALDAAIDAARDNTEVTCK